MACFVPNISSVLGEHFLKSTLSRMISRSGCRCVLAFSPSMARITECNQSGQFIIKSLTWMKTFYGDRIPLLFATFWGDQPQRQVASDFPVPKHWWDNQPAKTTHQRLFLKIIKNDQKKRGNEQKSRKIRGIDQENYRMKMVRDFNLAFIPMVVFGFLVVEKTTWWRQKSLQFKN